MAVLTMINCKTCGKSKQESVAASDYFRNECSECRANERNREEREWKAGREGLTIEERIRDIENFMYHHSRLNHSYSPTIFG